MDESWQQLLQIRCQELERYQQDHWHSTIVTHKTDSLFVLPTVAYQILYFTAILLGVGLIAFWFHIHFLFLLALPFLFLIFSRIFYIIRITPDPVTIRDPVQFLKVYILSLIAQLNLQSYEMLAPWTKTPGKVPFPSVKHMPIEYDADEINGPDSLNEYWNSFLLPGEEAYRIPFVGRGRILYQDPHLYIAWVELEIFVRYTKGNGKVRRIAKLIRHLVTLLRGKTEKLILRKLLIYRHNRWFIAESMMEGDLDRVPFAN